MNILEQIAAKAEKGDTGMSLHYGFLYSCVVGLESKKVFLQQISPVILLKFVSNCKMASLFND